MSTERASLICYALPPFGVQGERRVWLSSLLCLLPSTDAESKTRLIAVTSLRLPHLFTSDQQLVQIAVRV